MGTAIAFLIAKGIPEKYARLILTAGLFLAALGLCGALIALYNHHVINRYQQQQQARATPAADQAAKERANDTITTTQHEQELHNVIAAQPDQPIAPTSHALACKRLHDAGRNPPACR